jgi:SAM-dependent methyltransferase
VIEQPTCPVCGENDWRVIGKKTYRLSDVGGLDTYLKLRYRVLFEIWLPGKSEIEIRSNVCRDCGFVTNTPRPSADDISAKYRLFSDAQAAGEETLAPVEAIDIRRADALYRSVAPHLPKAAPARILDFGGGDGRLMRRFMTDGHLCELVDYRREVFPGVVRIGSTEADIPAGRKYEAIVCSHVIEHVADPLGIIALLARHLSDRGVLFIEVPMEVWKKPPLHAEPVTHVNFFTEGSMRRLLARVGLHCVECRLATYESHGEKAALAVHAIGRRQEAGVQPSRSGGARETERLLHPNLFLKLKVLMLMPEYIPQLLAHRIRRLALWAGLPDVSRTKRSEGKIG